MADRQNAEQPEPRLCVFDETREPGEAYGVEHAGLLDPDQVPVEHQHQDGAADVWLRPGELLAAALADQREDEQQAQQQEAGISGEQQEPGLEADCEPIEPPPLARRPPVMQQDQRPQRRRKKRRAELRRRHAERRDAGHQQHRQHGVARTDHDAAEREHGPQDDDHADLREQVDGKHAADAEGAFSQPIGERRAIRIAEPGFVRHRQHFGELAGRRRVEQRRHQRPQHSLGQRRGPKDRDRPRPYQLDEKGYPMHSPARRRKALQMECS